ncbi:MAG: hypothetical protein ACRDL7_00990 [Gaiellaceae bacterium]
MSGNSNTTMTREQGIAAFEHLFKDVLGYSDSDPLLKAMDYYGITSIVDVATLSEEEVNNLVYEDGGNEKDVPPMMRKKLLHALWWRDIEANKRADRTADWLKLTPEIYEHF